MRTDAFSKCHPAVNFLFFVGAIGFSVVIRHPVYLLTGLGCGLLYYLLLWGAKGWKLPLSLLPLFAVVSLINPLFNTQGQTVLFLVFGRPYTWEALQFGFAMAGILVSALLWFGCYNRVLTGDKFTGLFGNLIPALSLLLVMVLRLVPNLIRKAKQLMGARRSIGKSPGQKAGLREKLSHGGMIVGALTSWALEGSVVTGDSMRARGYGTGKRTGFMIHRLTGFDWLLLVLIPAMAAGVIIFMTLGATDAQFVPTLIMTPVSGWHVVGFVLYCGLLLLPSILHVKEAIQWRISRSGI